MSKIGLKQLVKQGKLEPLSALNRLKVGAELNKETELVKSSHTYRWLLGKIQSGKM